MFEWRKIRVLTYYSDECHAQSFSGYYLLLYFYFFSLSSDMFMPTFIRWAVNCLPHYSLVAIPLQNYSPRFVIPFKFKQIWRLPPKSSARGGHWGGARRLPSLNGQVWPNCRSFVISSWRLKKPSNKRRLLDTEATTRKSIQFGDVTSTPKLTQSKIFQYSFNVRFHRLYCSL